MSRYKILTPFNIELDFDIPEFHKRLFAWMLDVIIAMLYVLLVFILAGLILGNANNDVFSRNLAWVSYLIMLPIWFYPLAMEILCNGQTLGKKILGIRVINENGGNATASQFIIRLLLRTSDLAMLNLILYFFVINPLDARELIESPLLLFFFLFIIADTICIIVTKKSQRLGDLAAGTILVNLRTKAGLDETVFMEMEDNYVPIFPEVMKLTDRDLNIIKSVYSTVIKKNDYALAERTASKIEYALKIQTNQHPLTFLETLLKDYNYLSTK
jgi:uncharacterized RDD family membrane protein YckC